MIRWCVVFMSLLFSVAMGCWVPVLAQCDSGVCAPGAYQPAQPVIAAAQPPTLAVCRLEVGAGAVKSIGTGTAISSNGQQTAILTARHVVGQVNTPVVAIFPNGLRLSGYTAVVCYEADAAIVVVHGRAPKIVLIAAEQPAFGTPVWYGGFDGQAGWQHRQGRLVRQTSTGDWVITGPARGGDSGGPVWNQQGLIGVVWGTDGTETLCTSLPQLVNFFASKRYVFPWNAWLEDRRDAREHGQVLPPQPMPRAPVPPVHPQHPPTTPPHPPAYSQPAPSVPTELLQRLASLESKLAAVEAKVSQLDSVVGQLKEQHGSAAAQAESAAGLAAAAKQHAEELTNSITQRIRDAVIGWLPVQLGVPAVLVVIVGGVLLFLIRRDIKNRMTTGDPLEIEKLLQRTAAKTPTQLDDWLVNLLSRALDQAMPRPSNSEPVTKKGKAA